MNSATTESSYFLVVSEGAWWPAGGSLPTGQYGFEWVVVRAETGWEAFRIGFPSLSETAPPCPEAITFGEAKTLFDVAR